MSNSNPAMKAFYKKLNERTYNTELIDPVTYDFSKLLFDEPIYTEIPAKVKGQPPVKFHRISIASKTSNNKEGLCIFECPQLPTYGLRESFDQTTQELNAYNLNMPLYDETGMLPEAAVVQEFISKLVERCKKHLMLPATKISIKKGSLSEAELEKMAPFSYPKDPNTFEYIYEKPTLCAKVDYRKPKTDDEGNFIEGKITTIFYDESVVDENGEPAKINPLDTLNMRGYIRPAIKVDSIFIGASIKVQLKIHETFIKIEQRQQKARRLLRLGEQSRQETVKMNKQIEEMQEPEQIEETIHIPVKTQEIPIDDDDELLTSTKKTATKKAPIKKKL